MRRVIASLAWLIAAAAEPAWAQGSAVVGDWSGTFIGADGVRRYAISLNADESFVSALAMPNGTMQRVWGRYHVERVNSTELRVTFSNQGWRPLQICVKELSLVPRCSPYTPAAISGGVVSSITPAAVVLKFTSPSSFQIDETIWNRDTTHPLLLSQLIPDHLNLMSIRGQLAPVVPTVKKYGLPP